MRVTPMLRQYLDAKEKHPDSLLLFRMGDFYELFFDDAATASAVLDIALTSRNKGAEDEIPMAGVPHHAANQYIQRLIEAGHKVAVCEQVEDPAKAKGLVAREVVRVITPGVVFDVDESRARQGNYLAAVAPVSKTGTAAGVAFCDVSTGELWVTEVRSPEALFHELARAGARELLVPDELQELFRGAAAAAAATVHISKVPRGTFSASHLARHLRDLRAGITDREHRSAVHEPVRIDLYLDAVESLGLRHPAAVRAALAALLCYVADVQQGVPAHVAPPAVRRPEDHVALDAATEANLEIFQALIGGGRAHSLVAVVDQTVTAAGGRLLRSVLAYPLVDVVRIRARLDAVEALMGSELRRGKMRKLLEAVADIPRLTSRVVSGGANARHLVSLAASLEQVPELMALAQDGDPASLGEHLGGLDPCTELAQRLRAALVDDPPLSTSEGGMIRDGYNAELDELLALSRDGKGWLLDYELKQRKLSGIDSLKVRYNKVFGYYIEITRANLHRVPDSYLRKQTLANAERFFTLELKEYEEKILGAEERRSRLEAEIFATLVDAVGQESERLLRTASHLAWLDVLSGFAELAVRNRYTRPEVNDGLVTDIVDGRHPVVERTSAGERFVPNSVHLDAESEQLVIVTGPNMAGKSTIIRQVALIQLLGQVGSFVPAKQATLGVVDQIFSRVGASDNLAQGQSTFMVEMTQTAHILRHATRRSLIVLDEIGRGTSTFDGLSIAWAVAEHICDEIGARALFATHYHELTELAQTRERVRNASVAVKEWNDEIVFLRRLVDGPANQSYGIQVGRLAGLPQPVVERAKQVLANLEAAAYTNGTPTAAIDPQHPPDNGQLDLFGGPQVPRRVLEVVERLEAVKADQLSPLQALELVYSLKAGLESR